MSEVNHKGADFSNLSEWKYQGEIVRFAVDTGLGEEPIMLMTEDCNGDIDGWIVAYDDDELEYFPAPPPVAAMVSIKGYTAVVLTPDGHEMSSLYWLLDGEYELRKKVS